MATLQIRVDDNLKKNADTLFSSLGLDTYTAVRIFLTAYIEHNGIPFRVNHIKSDTLEAIEDARLGRNLHGPFSSAEYAIKAMLED